MKEYKVIVDDEAEDDLLDIYTYVALNDSFERADTLYSSIRRTCYKLKTLPLRGHVPAELFEIGVVDYRELHYKSYRIIYSVESTSVYIHCILDGRRDIQTILQERLLR